MVSGLEGKLSIPGIGPTDKKIVYAAGAGLALAVGVHYYRARNAAATATDTTVPAASINPATGYPYGSAEDAAATAAQAQYLSPGGSGVGSNPTDLTPVGTGAFTNNGDWERAAVDYLVNTLDHDPAPVGDALGKYVNGADVPDNEVTYVNQATAAYGQPPVPGANGYPPSIRHAAPSTLPAPLGTAPKVTEGTHRKGAAAITWTQTTGAASYHVHYNGSLIASTTSRAMTVKHNGRYQVFAVAHDGTSKGSNILTISNI